MKRFYILLLAALMLLPAYAKKQIAENAVTLVSYVQEYRTKDARLTLRNNTNEQITQVKGELTFTDQSGEEVGSSRVNEHLRMEPGETATVEVKSFKPKKYVSGAESPEPDVTSVKASFSLRNYSSKALTKTQEKKVSKLEEILEQEEAKQALTEADEKTWDIIRYSAAALIILFVLLFYFLIPIRMARKRGRNAVIWLLVGIIFTPLVSIIGLLVFGNK